MQPQVIRRKAHDHGAHAEIEPTGGAQTAHASIHHREAGGPSAPSFEVALILFRRCGRLDSIAGTKPVAHAREIAEFDARLILKFLHEVAVPTQAAGKAAQRLCVVRVAFGTRLGDGRLSGVVDASHRDGAKGQMRAEAAATVGCAEWTGHRPAIVVAAFMQETVQRLPSRGLASGLRFFDMGRGCELAQLRQIWQVAQCIWADCWLEAALQKRWFSVHATRPPSGPAEPRLQAAHNARLRPFMPYDAAFFAPSRHSQIACVSPARTRLFMTEQTGERKLRMKRAHGAGGVAHVHPQRQAKRCEAAAQLCQTVQRKGDVLRVALRAGQPLRFYYKQSQCAVQGLGSRQRGIVANAQVAFEPDEGFRSHCA